MISITEAVDELVANQKPILCLDTCDFLDVVRGLAEEGLAQARSFRKATEGLAKNPGVYQPVITYLVQHEWGQNLDAARSVVVDHIDRVDRQNDRIAEASGIAGLLASAPIARFASLHLADRLVGLAQSLLDQAMVLERDDECVNRAVERVMDRRRPSHKREIKDSIHWEHYIEFSRRLGAGGHVQDRIFVSANKADFWADKNTSTLHPDLLDEANASGLQFFGRMHEALRVLGV